MAKTRHQSDGTDQRRFHNGGIVTKIGRAACSLRHERDKPPSNGPSATAACVTKPCDASAAIGYAMPPRHKAGRPLCSEPRSAAAGAS